MSDGVRGARRSRCARRWRRRREARLRGLGGHEGAGWASLVARARGDGEGDEEGVPLPEPTHLRIEEASDLEWPIGVVPQLPFATFM